MYLQGTTTPPRLRNFLFLSFVWSPRPGKNFQSPSRQYYLQTGSLELYRFGFGHSVSLSNITWNLVINEYFRLSLKDQSLREVLEDKRSQEYVQVLVDALPEKRNFVFDLLEHVRDVNLFVERYITKDCDNVWLFNC